MRFINFILIFFNILLIIWLISLELEETPPTNPNDGQSGKGIMAVFLINLFSTAFFGLQALIFGSVYIFKARSRNTLLLVSFLISSAGLVTGIFLII